jgi:hypothetical protein
MMLGKLVRRAFGGAFALGLMSALTGLGCGGIGPGDYVIYRVAFAEAALTGDCAGNDDGDSSTFRNSETFVLYAGPNEKFYLDVGQVTIEGVVTDDGFKFSGESVDVDDNGAFTVTQRRTTTISVTVDGASISGTAVDDTSITCSGTGCPDNDTCKSTVKFVGSEIKGVALEHDPV